MTISGDRLRERSQNHRVVEAERKVPLGDCLVQPLAHSWIC